MNVCGLFDIVKSTLFVAAETFRDPRQPSFICGHECVMYMCELNVCFAQAVRFANLISSHLSFNHAKEAIEIISWSKGEHMLKQLSTTIHGGMGNHLGFTHNYHWSTNVSTHSIFLLFFIFFYFSDSDPFPIPKIPEFLNS